MCDLRHEFSWRHWHGRNVAEVLARYAVGIRTAAAGFNNHYMLRNQIDDLSELVFLQ